MGKMDLRNVQLEKNVYWMRWVEMKNTVSGVECLTENVTLYLGNGNVQEKV